MSSGKLNVRIYQLKKRYRAEQLNHDIIMDITVYIDIVESHYSTISAVDTTLGISLVRSYPPSGGLYNSMSP